MRLLGTFVLCLAAGCSLLVGDDDGGGDTGGPARDGGPFPPAETLVELNSFAVADLDLDGRDDLVLGSAPDVVEDRGIYVLAGPMDAAALGYRQFIPTGFAPRAIAVDNIGGDQKLELVVAGESSAGTIQIQVYGSDGELLASRDTDLAPEAGEPVHLVLGDFDHLQAEHNDLVLSVGGQTHLLATNDVFVELETAEAIELSTGADVVALASLDVAAGSELLIGESTGYSWRYTDDSGQPLAEFVAGAECPDSALAAIPPSVGLGNEIDLIRVTGANNDPDLCAYRLLDNHIIEEIVGYDNGAPGAGLLFESNTEYASVAAGNLDADDLPDLVVLDTSSVAGAAIQIVRDFDSTGAVVLVDQAELERDLLPTNVPAFVFIADLAEDEGQPQVWLIDSRGRTAQCLRPSDMSIGDC